MQTITKVIESFGRFGRCMSISNGLIEAYVTLDKGPRIIYLGACGGPNLFFTDEQDKLVQKGPEMDKVFGARAEFHFMGGHRLWLAPQHPIKTCMPDNKPVSYVIIEDGAIFTPPLQKEMGVQHTITITMRPTSQASGLTAAYSISAPARRNLPYGSWLSWRKTGWKSYPRSLNPLTAGTGTRSFSRTGMWPSGP